MKVLKVVAICAAVVVSIGLLLPASIVFGDWLAEHRARSFCESVAVGAELAPAIARFERDVGKPGVLHYGDDSGHMFLFKGFMFDKGRCVLGVSNGKVISKTVSMTTD